MSDDDGRSPLGRFGPLETWHPAVGTPCCICTRPLLVAEVTTLISLAPADAEEAAKAAAGRAYNSVAGIAHERCAYPGEGR